MSRRVRPSIRCRERSSRIFWGRFDFDHYDAQFLVADVLQAMRSARAVEDDMPGTDLELLAVQRHQAFSGHDDIELLVVLLVRVTTDVRPAAKGLPCRDGVDLILAE